MEVGEVLVLVLCEVWEGLVGVVGQAEGKGYCSALTPETHSVGTSCKIPGG